MNKIKNISIAIVFVSLFGLNFLILGSSASAAERFVCDDGVTLLPAAPSQGFNSTTFCASKGGYSGKKVTVCGDGVTIIPNGMRGDGAATAFCAGKGGLDMPPPGGSTTPTPSNSTEVDESGLLEGVDLEDTNADCEGDAGLTQENCGIIALIVVTINTLSAIAGIAIVGSIMVAGYQYMTARDNPGGIQKAKTRIIWAMVALLTYVFMYTILNFLVPGGLI